MKMSAIRQLGQSLVLITILSYLTVPDFAQGQLPEQIFEQPESPDKIAKELEKKKELLKKLDKIESSTKQKLFIKSEEFDYNSYFDFEKCNLDGQTGQNEKYYSCREGLLSNMCGTELMSNSESPEIVFCKQYIDLVSSNQSYYNLAKTSSATKLCRTIADKKERLKFLDHEILKKTLEFCQQAFLATEKDLNLLQNTNHLFHVLREHSKAKDFFNNLLDKTRNRFNEEIRKTYIIADLYTKKYERISILKESIYYPLLTFIGDANFATGNFDKAISFYMEADNIDKKYSSDESIIDGEYIEKQTLINSFIGSKSRLAYALAKQGKTEDGEKHLLEAINELENSIISRRYKEDGLALQELGSLLYSTQQSLLISRKEYQKALEVADRSRSVVYSSNLQGGQSTPSLTFADMQDLAKQQNATLVVYSIPDLPLYNYKEFRGQEDRIFIWLIRPDGKLQFQNIDISSNQKLSNSAITLNLANAMTIGMTIFAIAGISIAVFLIFRQQKRIAIISGLIGLSFGVVSCQSWSSTSTKPELRGKQISNQTENLSSLIQNAISNVGSCVIKKDSPDNCKLADNYLQILYNFLIKPIENDLPNNPDEQIIFVPYRGLHRIPFAALKSSDDQYLIEKHTIRVIPSLQTLKFISERASNTIRNGDKYLIVGNPVMPTVSFGIFGELKTPGQLKEAEIEAKEIAKLYGTKPLIGKDASIDAVESQLFNSKIIHLATHGYLNVGVQKAPALVFAAGALEYKRDGLLPASTIYGSRLLAEMAVLSACDTGLGIETIEGNLGMTRPFLVAGVPTVISSLWSVPDAPTSELMIDFYQNLRNTPNKAKALRQAMLDTIKKHPEPVNWAGFTLTGLAELPKVSASAQQVVGQITCSGIQGGDLSLNSRDLTSVKLKSSPTGFTVSFKEVDGYEHELELDEKLVVQKAEGWQSSVADDPDSKIKKIKLNGDFKIKADTRRSYCSFEGKLEFIGDAKSKLP